jgi:hypothetical protein
VASAENSVAVLRGIPHQFSNDPDSVGGASPGSELAGQALEGVSLCRWFLLLTVTFMPFPTAVLAEYIKTPQANIATVLYSGASLAMKLGFNVWWFCLFRPVRLLPASVSDVTVRRATIQILSGLALYAGTTVISYWFPIPDAEAFEGLVALPYSRLRTSSFCRTQCSQTGQVSRCHHVSLDEVFQGRFESVPRHG